MLNKLWDLLMTELMSIWCVCDAVIFSEEGISPFKLNHGIHHDAKFSAYSVLLHRSTCVAQNQTSWSQRKLQVQKVPRGCTHFSPKIFELKKSAWILVYITFKLKDLSPMVSNYTYVLGRLEYLGYSCNDSCLYYPDQLSCTNQPNEETLILWPEL